MTFPLEYHKVVNRSARHPIPASLALFGTLLLPLLLVSRSSAQINSTPAASSGSAHSVSAAPSSSTSHYVPANSGITLSAHTPHSPSGTPNNNNWNRQHHTATGTAYYPYIYAVPFPYFVDASNADSSDDDDAEYQGGPTIFDRRGSGPDSYVPPSTPDAPQEDASVAQYGTDPAPERPQPPTTLVFKDGHQLEVDNYAIVSQTLYDLTPGHPRKIALADLDLAATEKQNDDRGVTFQLPLSAQAN
ncbi:MAG: hypothetical protein WCA49_21775 [Candidatus Sulfotelmatobacter sp.]